MQRLDVRTGQAELIEQPLQSKLGMLRMIGADALPACVVERQIKCRQDNGAVG